MVEELEGLAKGQPEDSDVWREIRYIQKHGESGRLQYETFRRRGIPCGSGAIESTVRRVINLRLKSNAIYWLAENAEGVFSIRAALLCDRWDEILTRTRHSMASDRRVSWKWEAPDTSDHLKEKADMPHNQSQHIYGKQPTVAAA